MSEAESSTASRRRAERQTSSCTECRRRKQKCSQGQPCTNCVRRFPQPICEYKAKAPRRNPQSGVVETSPVTTVALREGPYSHLNPAGVQNAILVVEESRLDSNPYGVESPSSSSSEGSANSSPSPKKSTPWVPFKVPKDDNSDDPEAMLETLRVIFERRLTVANRIPEDDEIDEDARTYVSTALVRRSPTWPLEGAMDQLRFLPMAATRMNKELVRIHLQLLCRFKVSVDGNPDPNNAFMRYWVPTCVQDPLLLQIVLFTSACFFSETGHIPKTVAILHKGKVYQMLNKRLREDGSQTTDTSILGVVQMVVDSWYWGATSDLYAHIRGLKIMIRLRGGLQKLGLHGFLSKTILIHDVVMALAHEIEPSIYGEPGFEFIDPIMMPFHTALNSPLIFGWPSFAGCINSLQLHPSTALILDEMRHLFEAILTLPPDASVSKLQNVVTTAIWANDRISKMPEDTPSRRTPEPTSSSRSTSSRGTANSQDGQSPESCKSHSDGSPPTELPDLMYRCVRLTALVYCRAILNRTPTSAVCTENEFLKIWQTTWQVTLPAWKATIGIFVWVLLAIVPSSHNTGSSRFVKTLMVAGFMTIGVDNWHLVLDIIQSSLKLQQWLASGVLSSGAPKALTGGEAVVDRHGFAFKEFLPDLDLPIDE